MWIRLFVTFLLSKGEELSFMHLFGVKSRIQDAKYNVTKRDASFCRIVPSIYSDRPVVNCLGLTQEHDRQTDILIVNDALNVVCEYQTNNYE